MRGFSVALAARIAASVRVMAGVVSWGIRSIPSNLPPLAPGSQWTFPALVGTRTGAIAEPAAQRNPAFTQDFTCSRVFSGILRTKPEEALKWECGGPAGIRTQDQGIHVTPEFPPGVDYLFTLGLVAGRVRDARRLSSRALQPSGSLCTFRRCTAGLAQGCHRQGRKVPLNSSRPLRGLRRGGTFVMSPLH